MRYDSCLYEYYLHHYVLIKGLTQQVAELEVVVAAIEDKNDPMVARVSKRFHDLEKFWKRFLLRMQNREKALKSLYNFLSEATNVRASQYMHI